jgi:hypothetical protein
MNQGVLTKPVLVETKRMLLEFGVRWVGLDGLKAPNILEPF